MVYPTDVHRLDSPRFLTEDSCLTLGDHCRHECSTPLTAPGLYPFPMYSNSTGISVLMDDTNALKHPETLSRVSEERYNQRRHVCPLCLARFTRPSSLDTHINSHTGQTRKSWDSPTDIMLTRATSLPAYHCPHPKCGRQFSVKSNMLRHHRNHTPSGLSGTRRRPKTCFDFVLVDSTKFQRASSKAKSVELPQPASPSRAVAPSSVEQLGPRSPRLRQVFVWPMIRHGEQAET